ncbi:MAG TPA: SHOCT domain-containing protein [Candidatus Limnocylindria bacterium]|nr:SHOCT domain-containing protein [Candidatus Limnocylindria bacterium]
MGIVVVITEQEVFEMMFGTGMGWAFGVGSLAMILFWVFVVAGIAWLVLTLGRVPQRDDRAASILAERYARGEIDTEEYSARSRAIKEGAR